MFGVRHEGEVLLDGFLWRSKWGILVGQRKREGLGLTDTV